MNGSMVFLINVAVLSSDDDLLISHDDLTLQFETWQVWLIYNYVDLVSICLSQCFVYKVLMWHEN